MPRRTGSRCKPRAHATLDLVAELSMVWWYEAIPGAGFGDIEQLRAAWDEHGAAITKRMIECLPGQRPSAAYYLGEIPLPEPVNAARPGDVVTRWGDQTFFDPWRYWGTSTGEDDHYQGGHAYGEMLHLVRLGIVDGAEKRRALASGIDDRFYRPDAPVRRYEPLCEATPATVADDDA